MPVQGTGRGKPKGDHARVMQKPPAGVQISHIPPFNMPEYRESANPPHCKCGALKHSWGSTNLWHQSHPCDYRNQSEKWKVLGAPQCRDSNEPARAQDTARQDPEGDSSVSMESDRLHLKAYTSLIQLAEIAR